MYADACQGKTAYVCWTHAAKTLRRHHFKATRRDEKDGKRESGIYRCRICHHWHVGGGKERD